MSDDGRLVAGRYRLGKRLGKGGMGIVWLAYDERLRRSVAVKELLLPAHLTGEEAEQAKLRAMRESRIAARILHPNVIAIYDVVEADSHPCLVMEYLPSKSLSEVVAERGPLPPREVAHIGAQAARALRAAHVAGVVHRDVKPGNVLLGDGGIAKLADFGISRAAGDITVTATGLISGTPAYIAPEVAKGREATAASDVFSLGSTLYAAVEGTAPFGPADNAIALLHSVASGELNPPRRAGPLTEVLLELLQTDASRRPNMGVAAERLGAVAAGRAGTRGSSGTTAMLPPERTTTLPALEFQESPRPATRSAPAPSPTPQSATAQSATPQSGGRTQAGGAGPGAGLAAGAGGAAAGAAMGAFATTIKAPEAEAGTPGGTLAPSGPPPDTTPVESRQSPQGPPPVERTPAAENRFGPPSGHSEEARRPLEWAGTPTPARSSVPGGPGGPSGSGGSGGPSGSGGPTTKRRRRWSPGVLLSILAVLAAATLVAAVLVDQARRDRDTPVVTHSTGPSKPREPARTPTPTRPSTPPKPAEAATPSTAIAEYYELMPEDPAEGFTRLTSAYGQTGARGYQSYRAFWSAFEDVTASDITSEGSHVEASLYYVAKDGRESRERRSFTMVEEDGRWLISESEVIKSG